MATGIVLTVTPGNDEEYHIFLNGNDQIFIGEKTDRQDSNQVVLPIEDWPEIRKYIDGLYNEFIADSEKPFE